jgi:predicted lipid-binding transport protein (Tim44 family)
VAAVRLASAEAAEDDPAFAAERVEADAAALFAAVQVAWDARDRRALADLLGPDLLAEWTRRLDDFDAKGWHNRVGVLGTPSVEYVAMTNRDEDEADRVVVRIEARLEDHVETRDGQRIFRNGQTRAETTLSEWWTLAKRDGRWRLLSIEQDAEGAHHLDAPIVATPWGDDARLRDASLTELAVAERPPAGFAPGELADLQYEGTAREAALDLALADPRFDPQVLEVAVRRVVEAWTEAVDGPDAPLEALASRAAVDELLYGGDASRATRLVVRGARVDDVTVERLEADAHPPAMAVAATVTGRRYVQQRDTAAILSGSDAREQRFTVRWRLVLDGPDDAPWRLGAAADA